MRMRALTASMAVCIVLLGSTAFGGLRDGVKLEAGGKAIDVEVGHLVPCAIDWDEDGKKDLVVGQFSGGKIRFYRNHGTDSAPKFKDSDYLRAGGDEISLPAG